MGLQCCALIMYSIVPCCSAIEALLETRQEHTERPQ